MKRVISFCLCLLAGGLVESTQAEEEVGQWGIGLTARLATSPYHSDESTVAGLIPELYYHGQYAFLEGREGGVKLFTHSDKPLSVGLVGRLRFVDLPRELQNDIQEDSIDWGLRARYQYSEQAYWSSYLMSDSGGRHYLDLNHCWAFSQGALELSPYLGFRLKSRDFNRYYYGATESDGSKIGGGVESSMGLKARYPIASGFYLTGGIKLDYLDNSAARSHIVDERWKSQIEIGLQYLQGESWQGEKSSGSEFSDGLFPEGSYLRIAYGWATPQNIGDILSFTPDDSKGFDDTLTSLFYGYPLASGFYDLPLSVYITTGGVYHPGSSRQKQAVEGVVALKAYYDFSWPLRWRLGFAEGISYISRVTYVERSEMERKEYKPSKLMNYLDFSLDINVGDVLRTVAKPLPELDNLWLGYSIHHRSAIFEKASHFGRIKGGSNYNTLYLQYHF